MTDAATREKPMRADARRNRERLLAVAAEVFAEQGLDVGVAEISRRSGVGSATLFRHFPTKDDLVAAVLEQRLAEMEELAARGLEADDPWEGLAGTLRELVRQQTRDQAFAEAMVNVMHLISLPRLDAHRRRATADLDEILRRAQAAGVVRDDINTVDLFCLVCASVNAGAMKIDRPDLNERYLGIILDGLRPASATPLALGPPTEADLDAALAKKACAAKG